MFIFILGHADFNDYDLSSLRTGIMAGAPCPVETMNDVRDIMHCPEIVIAFGQTESSPVMTMTRRDDPVESRVSTIGRMKEMIIRSGENLYPREIEEFLHKHPKISDVYIVGIPDKRYGEQVLAAVILKAGEQARAYRFLQGQDRMT